MLSPEEDREIFIGSLGAGLCVLLCIVGVSVSMALLIHSGEVQEWESIRAKCLDKYTSTKCDELIGKTYDLRSPFYWYNQREI